MAASMDWCRKLIESELFKVLKKCAASFKPQTAAKNLSTIVDGSLFVWNAYDATLLTTKLAYYTGAEKSNLRLERSFQVLTCTHVPTFDVDLIASNQTGTSILVAGRRGVAIVNVPKHRLVLSDTHADHILCHTDIVAEREFTASGLQLVHAEWHPGSPTSTHIVLLTSDNVIRVYDVAKDCSQPEITYIVHGDASPTRMAIALGDTAVSFAFGAPFSTGHVLGDSTYNGQPRALPSQTWPVYILLGNGEVYYMVTTLDTRLSSTRSRLVGPLRMYPAAVDNYGAEACSILCLETQPSVLVIATADGRLHHCLLLNQPSDDDYNTDNTADEEKYHTMVPSPALYVYETVELELSLSTVSIETEDTFIDYFSCPIKLHKDPSSSERYHCFHGAGLHTVVLPWAHRFQQFCDTDGETSLSLSSMQHSVVEHLICTKPLKSSPLSPVLGICVISDHALGTKIFCVSSTFECIILPLMPTYRVEPITLLSDTNSSHVQQSPLRQLYREPFDKHIQRILHRTSSNPIIKNASSTEPSAQECLQLLVRATQVFREEYIQKLELAREEIEKRVRVMQAVKEQLQTDLDTLERDRDRILDMFQQLEAKYGKICDSQSKLATRIESILHQLQQRVPVLSDAERDSSQELKEIDAHLSTYESKVKMLNSKLSYQKSFTGAAVSTPTNLSDRQMKNIHTLLKKEGDDISQLVKQVNVLKASLIS